MAWTRRRFLSACATGALAGTGWAVGIEPSWLRVERHAVALPRLEPAFDRYRVVQLSDLHVGGAVTAGLLADAVARAAALRPDLVVVTGDLLDRTAGPGHLPRLARVLAGLRAPDGVYATLGNHDTGAYLPDRRIDPARVAALDRTAARAGVRVLHNGAAMLRRGRARLQLAGYDDRWCGRYRPDSVGVGERAPCTLALAHNPDCAPDLARRGADLVLCGHTHGGQVHLPLVGSPWLPVEHREFVAGPYDLGATRLYVHRGLGWTWRVRFGAPPEVTLHELRRA